MFSCEICGRKSKSIKIIEKCSHPKLKKSISDNIPINVINEKINIDTIFHCSDIHIRLNKYHYEYYEVFSNFYKMLSERKIDKPNSIIIICGDILHSKLELNPESIMLTLDFLENLSNIFPTFIIAGNHDALLTNNQRKDSLSGILYKRNIPNLWFLKESGIYKFGNINLIVNSLLDDKFIISSQLENLNGYKISLYHGCVGCPINSEGFKLSGSRNISDFNGFDLVLLGDIHMFQYLNNEKTIAYSSSLISQNYGETDKNHGFIEWNLINKTSNYHIVDNPYRFLSYIYYNGFEEDFFNLEIPDKCNLKLKISKENVNIQVIDEFVKKIRKVYPNIKLVINWIPSDTINKNEIISNEIDIQKKLEEYINEIYNLEEKEKEWILKKIDLNENQKPQVQWELIEMKWDYLCKYSKDNIFDFRKLDKLGLNGIIANNSAGKSSLLDILCFLLFGCMTRNISNRKHIQPDIINIHHNSGKGEIVFRILPNDYYLVEKVCKRVKDNSIKVNSSVWKLEENLDGEYSWDNKKWDKINLSGIDRIDNDKIIEDLIGSYEDFINGSICLQFDNKSFRSMAPKARKEYLLRVFNLEQFLNQYDSYRKQYLIEQTKFETIREKQSKIDFELLGLFLKEFNEKTLMLTLKIKKYNEELIELQSNYEEKLLGISFEKIEDYQIIYSQLEKIKEEIIGLNEMKKDTNKDELVKQINNYEIINRDLKEQLEILLNNKEAYIPINKIISEQEYSKITKEISDYGNIDDIDYRIGELTYYEKIDYSSKEDISKERLEYIKNRNNEIDIILEDLEGPLKKFSEIEEKFRENEKRLVEKNHYTKQIELWKVALDDLHLNHEYNPNCYICMRNSNTKRLIEYQNLIVELEERLNKIVINDLINDEFKDLSLKLIKSNELKIEKIENTKVIERLEKIIQLKDNSEKLVFLQEFKNRIEKWNNYKRNIDIVEKNKQISFKNKLIDEEIDIIRKEIRDNDFLIKEKRGVLNNFNEINSKLEILLIKQPILEQKLERAKKNIDSKRLESESKIIKKQIEELEIHKVKSARELEGIIIKTKEIEIQIEEYEKNKEELGKVIIEMNRYNILKDIVGPKGFSLWLLEDYLKEMSKGITDILWEMIKLKFEIKVVGNDIVIYSYRGEKDGEVNRLDMYGGMESFLIDLSFKIVLMELSRIPKCLFLLIDEGIASFDNNNLSNLENLWDLLGNIYQNVILITHIDKCKDYLTNIISIETEIEGKYSKLLF